MKLAILMDSLRHINPKKDTSLAILSQAELRHWKCHYFTLLDLFAKEGRGFANASVIHVAADGTTWTQQPATVWR